MVVSKVNVPHVINVRNLCVANMVTRHLRMEGNETFEVHRMVGERFTLFEVWVRGRFFRRSQLNNVLLLLEGRCSTAYKGRLSLLSPGPLPSEGGAT